MALPDAASTVGGTKQSKQKQARGNTTASRTLACIVGKKFPQSKASSDSFIVGDSVTMYGTT
ncbi:hypothetical protein IFR04_005712 [Cadophora malorum]|uniref:Uncharacterized protein n=1 Tax=Cadophora malorum TaxID=108018 RepID=A0A8H7TKE9_9HELO|nr:hypothetical protein IFR04_005712 [Cadophora malorum]